MPETFPPLHQHFCWWLCYCCCCVRVHMCACVFVHRPRHHATQTFPVLFLNAPLFHIAHLGLGSSWSYFCARDEVDTNFIYAAPTTGCWWDTQDQGSLDSEMGASGGSGGLPLHHTYLSHLRLPAHRDTSTATFRARVAPVGFLPCGTFSGSPVTCFLWQDGSGVHSEKPGGARRPARQGTAHEIDERAGPSKGTLVTCSFAQICGIGGTR